MSINKVRSVLYGAGKLLGHVQAVRKGPAAVVKRILRVQTGKAASRGMNKLFK